MISTLPTPPSLLEKLKVNGGSFDVDGAAEPGAARDPPYNPISFALLVPPRQRRLLNTCHQETRTVNIKRFVSTYINWPTWSLTGNGAVCVVAAGGQSRASATLIPKASYHKSARARLPNLLCLGCYSLAHTYCTCFFFLLLLCDTSIFATSYTWIFISKALLEGTSVLWRMRQAGVNAFPAELASESGAKRLLLTPHFLGVLLVTRIVEEQHFGSKGGKNGITLTAPNFQMLIALGGL